MPQRGTAARSVARRKDLSTGTDDGNAARVTTATMGVAQALQDADASRSQFKTEEQKAAWMAKFDVNHSGSFDRAEFVTLVQDVAAEALSAGKVAPQPVTIPDRLVDKEFVGKESLDADEGFAAVQRVLQYVKSREKLRGMFEQADTSGDGQLNREELKLLLQRGAPGGYTVTQEDCAFVIGKCDADDDAMVSIDELGPAIACWMELTARLATVPETPRTQQARGSSACVLL